MHYARVQHRLLAYILYDGGRHAGIGGCACRRLDGRKPPPYIDGLDISPLLRNTRASLPREALYWHYPHFSNQGGRPGGAVRAGDWKLIENYEFGDLELYNLANDIGESRNLAKAEPARAEKMRAMLKAWRDRVGATMPPPNPEYKKSNT